MADIQLMDLQFQANQAPGSRFPVTVAVENNETVAPLWGAEALCSNSALSPDGHRVIVTFTVRNAAGQQVAQKTTEVCATVEQPSNVAGETRASVRFALDQPGDYTIEAHGRVPGAGGEASAQPKSLTVGQGPDATVAGNEDADRGNDTDFNPFNSTDGNADNPVADVIPTGNGTGGNQGNNNTPMPGLGGGNLGLILGLVILVAGVAFAGGKF